MLNLTKTLFISALTFSLAACSTGSETQTGSPLPSSSPAASSAASPSAQTTDSTTDVAEADLLQANSPNGLTITGMSAIEKNAQGNWRWALGPETRVTFNMSKAQPVALDFSFTNPIRDQDVVIEANGVTVERIENIKLNDTVKRRAEFQGVEGSNTVVFKYKGWNTKPVTIAPNDKRPMAISFTQLKIQS